jgi:hypothetical protein
MRQKVLTGFAFAFLIAAGTVAAGIVASKAPSSVQQTVSTATTGTTTTVATTTTVGTTTTTPARKVRICHHTKGKKGTKHVTVTVSQRALKAHLRHGDSVGACNTAKAKKFHNRAAHVKKFHKKAKRR